MTDRAKSLLAAIGDCRLCAERFSRTETGHEPNPVAWFHPDAKVLIAGQAPGLRVHRSGRPFTDPSGDRLREWMGVGEDIFYDKSKIAIVPMAFCFPGYDARGSDLPPPKICGETWHRRVMRELANVKVRLFVGAAAQKWHLGSAARASVTETVRHWQAYGPDFPLPHPSWRNNAWIRKNPWFSTELLPELRLSIQRVLG